MPHTGASARAGLMFDMKKTLSTFFLCCVAATASAQYTIYPVPQSMTAQEGQASFSENVCIVCDKDIDQYTKNRALQVLSEHGLKGDITDGEQQCTSVIYLKVDPTVAVAGKFDAHNITLEAMTNGMACLTITGQNTDATFMGLASLEQMLDAKGATALPCVVINDYADQQQRGLVEGYYGYPYSVEVKKDLMRFMMRMKMNSYMYGAKSDPYHLSKWQEAYPVSVTPQQEENGWLSQKMVEDICQTSAETKVNFIWSIHPGNNIINSSTVVSDVMAKYEKMYKLGVRQFGLFVDDVGVPEDQTKLETNAKNVSAIQEAIDKKWNGAGAEPADMVKPLNFVPQVYCTSFAKAEVYERFFTALASTPQKIIFYTTGNGVWSVPNATDFNAPKKYLGRDVAWWWNYPCNDNADSQIYPMDMYQNFVDMPAVDGSRTLPKEMNAGIGIVCNPMQQGEVAKIPLFSAADYAWNNSGFVNKKSWEASFPFILRDEEKAAALKTLAPYLTKNDPSGKFPATTDSKAKTQIADLLAAVDVVKAFAESDVESDRLLWRDLSPWVLKLEQMLHAAEFLIAAKNTTRERDGRWADFTKGVGLAGELESKEDFTAYTLEGMYATVGTPHVAQPAAKFLGTYINNLKTTAVKNLIPTKTAKAVKFTNTAYAPTVTTSGNDVYAALAANTYNPGEYLGIELPAPTRLKEMFVADTLVQHVSVMLSADGHEWTRLETTGEDTRTVDGYVKYVAVVNDSETPVSFKLTKSVLKLTLLPEPTISSIVAPTENDEGKRTNIYDGDVSTWWSPKQNQANGDVIRLNLSGAAPIRKVRFVLHTTNGDYMKTGRIEISDKADSGYKKLYVDGKAKTTFTLDDMTPLHADGTPYAAGEKADTEIFQIYMDGKGQTAQYVRFFNQSATTSKWIRVAEFTPIFDIEDIESLDAPELCDGLAYTSSFFKAGQTADYRVLSAYDVEKAEAFTSRGIIPVEVDEKGVISIPCGEDTYIYEVVVTTTKTAPALVTTGLRTITADAPAAGALYDLQGRRVTKADKGIYIVGGKKVIR